MGCSTMAVESGRIRHIDYDIAYKCPMCPFVRNKYGRVMEHIKDKHRIFPQWVMIDKDQR